MKSLVSIITPVFNAEKNLAECIESVLAQTHSYFEHILVDDCSTDRSVEIIKKYNLKDHRIKYTQLNQNSGAGVSRNTAIEMASGRYIAFLDSDDYWDSNKLKKQLSFMKENNYSFVYSQYIVIKDKMPLYLIKSPSRVDLNMMLKNDYVGCLTAIYDTEKLGKNYMPKIRKRQDWVLWLNLLKKVKYAYGIQEPLAYYRIGDTSLSKNKFGLLKHNFNVYNKELNMSFLKSLLMMFNFLIHYFHFKLTSKKVL